MKRSVTLISVFFVALLVGSGLGYSLVNPARYEGRITNLENEISNLNSRISTLQSEKSTLESQASKLEQQIEAKNGQISDLEQEKGILESQLSVLDQQIETKNSEISSLQSQISGLEAQIAGLEEEVSRLEQQLEIEVLGVNFSPRGGCEDQILYWINRANVSIHILIYSFTLDSIGDALVEAHKRGVEVQVVFEKSQVSQYSEYQKLKAAGIAVRNDTNSKLMHNKIMIIDGIILVTGSFNWSNNAENYNNENLIVIDSAYISGIYEEEFIKIWNESQPPPPPPSLLPQEGNVVIWYVHYDAEGNDWYNLNDEYVVIWNQRSVDVDLTAWMLKDEANHRFYFPSFVLEAGEKVTVYTGSGTNTKDGLYWGSGSPIWNNDHDTAYLYDQNMELIDEKSW